MDNKKISFWKIFWPSLIAGIVLILLFLVLFTGIIGSLIDTKPTTVVKDNSVLHLQLDGKITEVSNHKIDLNSLGGVSISIGLSDIMYGLKKAQDDKRIKGVFIELKGANCGYSTATDIRNAIKEFEEKSGKWVVAYHSGEVVTLKEYYIASAASENYGFHSSNFDFLGLGAELMFYKGLFDKLDVEMQVIRGSNNDFKSAIEPFFREDMSDSSRLQTERYLDNIWSFIKEEIHHDRGVSVEELDDIANNIKIQRVTDAVKHKLIDKALYRDEVLDILTDKLEIDNREDINFQSFKKYAKKRFENDQTMAYAKNANIAVIIAEGGITKNGSEIASDRLVKEIQKARNDKHIKAVVLRVNSPGGSALASDEIWREIELTKEEKPVIASMGDVAASGGYYISTGTDKIFAESTTITGSIGVFGMIPYTGGLMKNKLGITFDQVKTNEHSVLSTNQKFSPEELQHIQDGVDQIYEVFLGRVAEGRNMTKEQVNKIARGRVWTGNDALNIGLVDTLGNLQNAIDYAVSIAEVSKPIVRYYPQQKKDFMVDVLEMLNDEEEAQINKTVLPEEITDVYSQIKSIEDMTGIQARMPYIIIW